MHLSKKTNSWREAKSGTKRLQADNWQSWQRESVVEWRDTFQKPEVSIYSAHIINWSRSCSVIVAIWLLPRGEVHFTLPIR